MILEFISTTLFYTKYSQYILFFNKTLFFIIAEFIEVESKVIPISNFIFKIDNNSNGKFPSILGTVFIYISSSFG